jgi:hypothetical protein
MTIEPLSPYRKRHTYPPELQKVVLDAYVGGVPTRTLAKTVSASVSTVKLWISLSAAPAPFAPEEGTLAPAPAPIVCSLPAEDAAALIAAAKERALAPAEATVRRLGVTPAATTARVTFPSGVKLTVPADVCCDPRFLAAIAQIGVPP